MGAGSILFEEIQALKEQDLSAIPDRMQKALFQAYAHEQMNRLLAEINSHPGKMIRPLLVLLSAGDYPEETREELLCAAAAAELVHIASLLHDDIIDKAEIRRGYPSVQAKYGIPTAICAGDYLLIKSFSYLNDLGYHSTAGDLMNAALEVCNGELIQDAHQFDTSVSEEVYLESIRGKTAAVFAECCAIGGRIAGRPVPIRRLLKSYGETLGMMFQIRDDILDWTRNDGMLKKTVNEDFRNGIYTLPVIYTFGQEPYGTSLKSLAAARSATDIEFEEVCKAVFESGGIAYAKGKLDSFAEKALELLKNAPQDRYSTILKDLIQIIRDSV